MAFRQGQQPGLFGPPMLGAVTPQNNEGLGLPNGQAMFNLPRTSAAMNLGLEGINAMAPSLKFSIQRTASTDPVQNIINDMQNPLGGINIGPMQQPVTMKPQAPPPGLSDLGGFNPWRSQTMAPPGQQAGVPWAPTMAPPGQNLGQMARFGLKQRMTSPTGQFTFL